MFVTVLKIFFLTGLIRDDSLIYLPAKDFRGPLWIPRVNLFFFFLNKRKAANDQKMSARKMINEVSNDEG